MHEVFLLGVAAARFERKARTAEETTRSLASCAMADAGLPVRDRARVERSTSDRCSTDALARGWAAINAGDLELVLCLGAGAAPLGAERRVRLQRQAATARSYMSSSGATVEQFARLAAQGHRQGARNAAGAMDAASVLRSPVLAWPLRELMVAHPAAGGAAVLLGSVGARRRLGGLGPRLSAAVVLQASGEDTAVARAARLAFDDAGLGPEDIDVAEIDDLSSAAEIAAYEALQFAPEGLGPELVDSGFTARGGVLPVNPTGGPLARGDTGHAAALIQLVELARHLETGPADARPRAGLALCCAPSGRVGLTVLERSPVPPVRAPPHRRAVEMHNAGRRTGRLRRRSPRGSR